MSEVRVLSARRLGHDFVPLEFLPAGCDEHYLRNRQQRRPACAWRHLRAGEIETLVKNGNTADDWDNFRVVDPFDPRLIKNSEFAGLVRLGKLEPAVLEHHELRVPTGIVNSLVIACDLGDNVAIRHVRYLAHFIVGDHAMLLNVDEMSTTNHAKFGAGIVKEGEPESLRMTIELMNEAGGRGVAAFEGMIPADAYLWARHRDNPALLARLVQITQNQVDPRRGYYGVIGDGCVVKNSRVLKDVKIGPHCYVKGANKLKNLAIQSSAEEPTQIGEGVEMVNGIVGLGCHVFYGCKAVRFVLGNNSKLKYGARLIHSCLGDNSTVSCCEILNNLVFPGHEQHHNNSFLIASLVLGQSNVAAAASIGSNHNSRAPDGELVAGRGFWPALGTTVKHPSRFASFTLLAQGSYRHELDITLPFSLVSDEPAHDRLVVMPAYWWMYNLYALARNAWKFQTRDTRKTRTQNIEFDYLAPDTIEEIVAARTLLCQWTASAAQRAGTVALPDDEGEQIALGHALLTGDDAAVDAMEILAPDMENSRRPVVVLKARQAYRAYGEMLHYFGVRNLLDYVDAHPGCSIESMRERLDRPRIVQWVNMGGQLMPAACVARLIDDILAGRLASWTEIHDAYAGLWREYPLQKQRHALAVLRECAGASPWEPEAWSAALDEAVRIQRQIASRVYETRKKDFDDPFRRRVYQSEAEMQAVLGTPEENAFVRQVRRETEALEIRVDNVRATLR